MWDGQPYFPKNNEVKMIKLDGYNALMIIPEDVYFLGQSVYHRAMFDAHYVLIKYEKNMFEVIKDRSYDFVNSVLKKEYPSAVQHIINGINPIRFSIEDDDDLMLFILMTS